MLEVMAQRYGTPPWEIRQAPAHDVYRHGWLLSFRRATEGVVSTAVEPPTEEQEMLAGLASRSTALV